MNRDALRDMLLTAEMQARLCHALYTQGEVAALAAEVGADWRTFESGHVAAGALIFPQHVYLSVTGSNDRQDWRANRRARQVLYRDGYMVHAGYADACGRLLGELRRSMFRVQFEHRRLVLGGHSAGGAIAQLLSLFYPSERVVTFGCPRVFDPDSAVMYAAGHRHDRYVRPGDPVTQLPLRTHYWLFGGAAYRHSSASLHLTPDGLRTDESSGVLQRIARRVADVRTWGRAVRDDVIERLGGGIAEDGIYQHSMPGYLADVQAALQGVR